MCLFSVGGACYRRKNNGLSSKIRLEIFGALEDLDCLHPSVLWAGVLSGSGNPLATRAFEELDDVDDVGSHVVVLRRMAAQLGSTMGLRSGGAIHVQGASHTFSCYQIYGDAFLVFYSRTDPGEAGKTNWAEVDFKMKEIIARLKMALHEES